MFLVVKFLWMNLWLDKCFMFRAIWLYIVSFWASVKGGIRDGNGRLFMWFFVVNKNCFKFFWKKFLKILILIVGKFFSKNF